MSSKNNKIPSDPLSFIKQCVKKKQIFWTYHVNMRMKERFIPRDWIVNSFENFEIIEAYPEDKYLPSYLVWSKINDVIFHILFSVDAAENNVRIITAYKPAPDQWTDKMKRRINK
jgi:hypothetical protein